MCIIVYKPENADLPDMGTLRRCWERNPHGAGIMRPDGGKVAIRKGLMEWAEFEQALAEERALAGCGPMALHFRIATHGAVKPGCTHPFAVCKDYGRMRRTRTRADVGFMHNGTLSGLSTSNAVSDSMAFARNVIAPLRAMCADVLADRAALRVIGASTQGSRFLIMDGKGEVRMFGRWHERDGVFYSNDLLMHPEPRSWREPDAAYSQVALFDAFTAFSGAAEDLTAFGLYAPCARCQMLRECAEYLPYCADEGQAAEVAGEWPAE